MRLHVLAPPPLRILRSESQSAHAGLILRFAKMMQTQDFRVIEYHCGDTSDSAAEHVSLLSEAEAAAANPMRLFAARALSELTRRVNTGDVVCYPYGPIDSALLEHLPHARHTEILVGYDRGPFGAVRVFPSQAWRHWHFARYEHVLVARHASAVIPHYFDVSDWDFCERPGDYVLFAGRLAPDKTGALAALIVQRPDLQFVIAGDGNADSFKYLPNAECIGVVRGRDRSELFGKARAIVCPTTYVEPFGCVAIEANLCGTPVVASNFGAYVETVHDGVSGVLSNGNWAAALDRAVMLDRAAVREQAELYSTSRIGPRYADFFRGLQ